jgi:hypothetical protein
LPHLTKAERALAKVIVAHLSFERYTEREIVEELKKKDPPINLSKTAVHDIRVALEKQAEKWYVDLRDSKYRYLATYKDRIDSLFKYQNMLHQAIKNREIDKMSAIRELHSIERTIKDIYKEVPQIGVPIEDVSTVQTEEPELESTSTSNAEQWV